MCYADMFVLHFRANVNHKDDKTTSICEGYHGAIKRVIRAGMGEHLRLDRFINFLLSFVEEIFIYRCVRLIQGATSFNYLRLQLMIQVENSKGVLIAMQLLSGGFQNSKARKKIKHLLAIDMKFDCGRFQPSDEQVWCTLKTNLSETCFKLCTFSVTRVSLIYRNYLLLTLL